MSCKHTPFGLVDFVWEPRYSTKDFLVDKRRLKKMKVDDFKVRFSKVNSTSEWGGDWRFSRDDLKRVKTFNNNGLPCYVVGLDKLKRIELKDRCEHSD